MTEKPLVRVVWDDAHATSTTAAFSEHEIPHAPIRITTYGLLLREDEKGVTVASEACADGTYRGLTFVMRVMLVSIEPVVKASGRRGRRRAAPLSLPPSASSSSV